MAPDDHVPCCQKLQRMVKRVKFDRTIIIRRTEIRFLIMCGETRILCRCKEQSVNKKEVEPIAIIGKEEPLSIINFGGVKEGG